MPLQKYTEEEGCDLWEHKLHTESLYHHIRTKAFIPVTRPGKAGMSPLMVLSDREGDVLGPLDNYCHDHVWGTESQKDGYANMK